MGLRGDAILQFDWSVGEVLRKLEEEGIADNTLIILSSDNGPVVDDGYQDRAEELLGDHRPTGPLRGNKYSAFEGGTRVPALVRWPEKIKENKVSDALLSQIDWIASFAKMFDITLPENAAPDSRDQLRAWCGKTQKGCDYVIEQSTGLSIRTDRWKYIEPNNGTAMVTWGPKVETGNAQVPQLYDLKKGDEYTNLAEQHPEIVEELSSLLQKEKNKAVQER